EIEGSLLMMTEENPDWGTQSPLALGGNPLTLSLYVKDVDQTFKQAIVTGAKSLMDVMDEFYGDRVGKILDPFGYKWLINTHKEEVSVEEMQKRLDKLMR
ncbi:MAG TPA: VOC family protein, partial [Pelobium sp.]